MQTHTYPAQSQDGNRAEFAPVVSWFPHSLENLPERDVPASEFFEAIRKGHCRSKVEEIRARFTRALARTNGDRETAKKAVATQKKRLPCVTLSGVFSIRAKDKLQNHSGLLQADIDLLGDRKTEIREALKADPHVYALFESPTGDGLKAAYRVTPCATAQEHEAAHATVAAHVKTLCGLDIDATGDVSRLCFASFDPQLYFNPEAVELATDPACLPLVSNKGNGAPAGQGYTVTNATERQRIAQELVGPIRWQDATTGFCDCPGKARHTNGDGEKDCKVWLENVPTLKCMHTSCAGVVDGVNHELRSRIGKTEWTAPLLSSVERSPTPADAVAASPSEFETELEFARRLTAALPPVKTVGNTWHTYKNGVWQTFSRDLLKPQALAILPEPIRTIRRATTLLDHVEGERQTDPETFRGFHGFDGGAVMLNTRNGVLRVTPDKVELLPHAPEHAFTRQTAAAFNPQATAPLFERVLSEVLPDPEDRDLFQLCLGNFLYPDCRFEVAAVCYGEAGRGKSTVADPVTAALGTDLVCRLSMAQICDTKSYHLPSLRFAAVNLGTELTTEDISESGNFKTLVSAEPIEARPIYGAPFVMQTTAKLWFLANTLPRFKFGTEAELRRTRFLRFDYVPPVKDVTLKARLAAETEGVLLFMVRGLQRLLTCAEIPIGGRESREVHDRFRVSNDPVGAFVACRCVLDRETREPKEHLRNAFAEFTQRHELPLACREWFFKVLYERFPSLRETQARLYGDRVRCVAGISLRSTLATPTPE